MYFTCTLLFVLLLSWDTCAQYCPFHGTVFYSVLQFVGFEWGPSRIGAPCRAGPSAHISGPPSGPRARETRAPNSARGAQHRAPQICYPAASHPSSGPSDAAPAPSASCASCHPSAASASSAHRNCPTPKTTGGTPSGRLRTCCDTPCCEEGTGGKTCRDESSGASRQTHCSAAYEKGHEIHRIRSKCTDAASRSPQRSTGPQGDCRKGAGAGGAARNTAEGPASAAPAASAEACASTESPGPKAQRPKARPTIRPETWRRTREATGGGSTAAR